MKVSDGTEEGGDSGVVSTPAEFGLRYGREFTAEVKPLESSRFQDWKDGPGVVCGQWSYSRLLSGLTHRNSNCGRNHCTGSFQSPRINSSDPPPASISDRW